MACPKPEANCGPCEGCGDQPAPTPVLPRCQDVVFPDGVWTNPTLVTEGGCIVEIQQGNLPLYQPDPCCVPLGGGGTGGDGLPGEQGPAGEAATVVVGSVTTSAPGTNASVTNSGTNNHAILNFTIPRGAPGTDGDSPTGLTGSFAGLELADGAVQAMPVNWPPFMSFLGIGLPGEVIVTGNKDAAGLFTLTVDLRNYDLNLRADMQALIDNLQSQIDEIDGGTY